MKVKTADKLYLKKIFEDSVRLYFAPVTGAVRAVKAEWRRIDRERQAELSKR